MNDTRTTIARIEVLTHELHLAIKATASMSGTDKTLPVLMRVSLEITGGHLVLAATDRFRIGVSRVAPVEGHIEEMTGNILVDAVEIKNRVLPVTKLLKPEQKWHTTTILVTEDEHGRRAVTFEPMAMRGEITLEGQPEDFPAWRQLFPKEWQRENGTAEIAYTADLLASFKAARRHVGDKMLVGIPENSGRPTVIAFGDYFIGLLMPVRTSGGDEDSIRGTLESWGAILRPSGK